MALGAKLEFCFRYICVVRYPDGLLGDGGVLQDLNFSNGQFLVLS